MKKELLIETAKDFSQLSEAEMVDYTWDADIAQFDSVEDFLAQVDACVDGTLYATYARINVGGEI